LESECTCVVEPERGLPPEKQRARIRLEKRKKGKWVTTIRDLDPSGDHLPRLLTRLKQHCGSGGTLDEGTIEVQGDHVQRVMDFLRQWGYHISK